MLGTNETREKHQRILKTPSSPQPPAETADCTVTGPGATTLPEMGREHGNTARQTGGSPGASSPDVNAIINPTPPPPYDAAQDKLHAVQEGAEPSYAAVTAGDAPASPTTSSRRRSSSGAGAGAGAGAGTRAAGGGEEEDKKKKKWVIKAQSDFYNTPDQARLVAGVSPASVVTSLMQLTATVWCAAAAGVVGWVFGMLRPITVSVMLWFEYLRFVVRRLWYYALGGIHSEGYGSGVGRMKGGGDEKKGRGRI
ncbi:hypothetical protein VTJ49DRAFT_6128 [Mycothermus thermophilus]|uniref:Uncharacterized protein n=1 Tax=Humicola insolens TaxID=85995 RepID=A0ABR3VL05_HUMIN